MYFHFGSFIFLLTVNIKKSFVSAISGSLQFQVTRMNWCLYYRDIEAKSPGYSDYFKIEKNMFHRLYFQYVYRMKYYQRQNTFYRW